WGHLRHFGASAVATEDIDSRDWMTPDEPDELCARIAGMLRPRGERGQPREAPARGVSLTERIGRDVWIDYVADTGDDSDVSAAMASLMVRDYWVPELAPRGASSGAPHPASSI